MCRPRAKVRMAPTDPIRQKIAGYRTVAQAVDIGTSMPCVRRARLTFVPLRVQPLMALTSTANPIKATMAPKAPCTRGRP